MNCNLKNKIKRKERGDEREREREEKKYKLRAVGLKRHINKLYVFYWLLIQINIL